MEATLQATRFEELGNITPAKSRFASFRSASLQSVAPQRGKAQHRVHWSCRKLGSVLGLSKDVGVRQRADLMPRKCKKCWAELPYT